MSFWKYIKVQHSFENWTVSENLKRIGQNPIGRKPLKKEKRKGCLTVAEMKASEERMRKLAGS